MASQQLKKEINITLQQIEDEKGEFHTALNIKAYDGEGNNVKVFGTDDPDNLTYSELGAAMLLQFMQDLVENNNAEIERAVTRTNSGKEVDISNTFSAEKGHD